MNCALSGYPNISYIFSETVMAITFENALGVLPGTLQYRTQRAEILAGNIANVDTPNFKAKDLDFETLLDQELDQELGQQLGQEKAQLTMQASNPRHLTLPGDPRIESAKVNKSVRQPSADGNTVDLASEQSAFMRNRMEFETSFTFLSMNFTALERAIVGQ